MGRIKQSTTAATPTEADDLHLAFTSLCIDDIKDGSSKERRNKSQNLNTSLAEDEKATNYDKSFTKEPLTDSENSSEEDDDEEISYTSKTFNEKDDEGGEIYNARGPWHKSYQFSVRHNPMRKSVVHPGDVLSPASTPYVLFPPTPPYATEFETAESYQPCPALPNTPSSEELRGVDSVAVATDYSLYSPSSACGEGTPESSSGSESVSPALSLSDLAVESFLAEELRGNNFLTDEFLNALDSAVTKTVSMPSTETDSECMALMLEGLRSIDKSELDYITPSGTDYNLPWDDLEQKLDVSPVPDIYTPPMSPSLSTDSSAVTVYGQTVTASDTKQLIQSPIPNPSFNLEEFCVKAAREMKSRCDAETLSRSARRVASKSPADLCQKDADGDTTFMIVTCKSVNSGSFFENVFVLQQQLQLLKLCCDRLLLTSPCPVCGLRAWHTPLSDTNNDGDTALSCAIKMNHPEVVINYLCAGLLLCPSDAHRVFGSRSRPFYAKHTATYPVLLRCLEQCWAREASVLN